VAVVPVLGVSGVVPVPFQLAIPGKGLATRDAMLMFDSLSVLLLYLRL